MEVQINFNVINPEYSQEYADEYNWGKEGESNRKYLWASSFGIRDVKSISIIENEDFIFKGRFEGGEKFSVNVPNVHILRCHNNDGTHTDYAVAKSILNKTHQAKKQGYDVTRFYFYINSELEPAQISDHLVVARNEVPEILLR